MSMDDPLVPPPRSSGGGALLAVTGALVLSLLGNVGLLLRGPRVVERRVEVAAPAPTALVPPPQECPPAPPPECPACPVCDAGVTVAAATPPSHTGGGTPRPPRPLPVDQDAAAEGEGHLNHAETVGERDPVQVAAQRRVADGVDRIVASRSPQSAERFITRNLPAIASMDCAFRDPAAAEHVRMRLREMNALVRPEVRLDEARLTRYERDLRCPRE